MIQGWAVKWRSGPNNLDRKVCEHLIYATVSTSIEARHPILFKTRKAAREWAKLHYGYIAARRDLRDYPHDWRVPKVVRATMTVKEIEHERTRANRPGPKRPSR